MSIRRRKSLTAKEGNATVTASGFDLESRRVTMVVRVIRSEDRYKWARLVKHSEFLGVTEVASSVGTKEDGSVRCKVFSVQLFSATLESIEHQKRVQDACGKDPHVVEQIVCGEIAVPNHVPCAGRMSNYGGEQVYQPEQRRRPNPPRQRNTGPGSDKFTTEGDAVRLTQSIGTIARIPGERAPREIVTLYKEGKAEIDGLLQEINTLAPLADRLPLVESELATTEVTPRNQGRIVRLYQHRAKAKSAIKRIATLTERLNKAEGKFVAVQAEYLSHQKALLGR